MDPGEAAGGRCGEVAGVEVSAALRPAASESSAGESTRCSVPGP